MSGFLSAFELLLTIKFQRGMSMIEWEISYPSNPYLVFHDSRGIESGPESELGESSIEHIWSFIEYRRAQPRLRDQIHAIWFCLPMDNPRVPSESFELAFFERDVGVPVIVVLTMYEALAERVKDKLLGREPSKEEVRRHAQKNIMKPMRRTAYPPAGYVQTHHHGDGCTMLSEKTHKTIWITGLATTFAMSQQASARLVCQEVFQNALSDKVITRLGQMLQLAVSSKHLAEELTYDALWMMPFWRNTDLFVSTLHVIQPSELTLALHISVSVARCEYPHMIQPSELTLVHDISTFLAFTCILGIWTAKKSRKPWNFIKEAIKRLDCMPEFRETVLTSVKKTLKDFKGDRKKCSCALAELVVGYANELYKNQPLESYKTTSQS
ncbi:uncharacterized protein STEHIDRAFT_116689 [Stereum hirsutum FP-91666 SS1]|uniref:Uncharacterized protein n=1 Tax=Stereum hirsutum (strain FP-91666) TaxID=721885 RepID=R7RWQ4_STEHR|nr:uncharacterized protein STEHIDRAFT_116689 [Stereum hirsutum FP-91666 SS1]EIM79218.1 hypothetical protein STEHIDRAFT_116689 [Stereum hirsutum FP-91666 SS1]